MTMNNEIATYTQYPVKCTECGLHFIICTEYPEKHAATTIYCPECGNHKGNFTIWQTEVEGFICQAVPGEAELVYMMGNPIPRMNAEEKKAFDRLKNEVNEHNQKLLDAMREELKRREDDKNG